MSYLILWRAVDKTTLYESEEYEARSDADAGLKEFHEKYPWNTYLLVRIEDARHGTEKRPEPEIDANVCDVLTRAERIPSS
jgi:hypothetical protein